MFVKFLGFLALITPYLITTVCILLINKYFRNAEFKNKFWKHLFSIAGAISIPQLLLMLGYIFCGTLYSLPDFLEDEFLYLIVINFSVTFLLLILLFLINLIFWKLKNRKFMLLLSVFAFLFLLLGGNLIGYLMPVKINSELKEYNNIFEYLQNYKDRKGEYPENLNEFSFSNYKYPHNYYKLSEDKNKFSLYLPIGEEELWAYCSDQNDSCIPDEWCFWKDYQYKWSSVSEEDKNRLELKKFDKWNIYFLGKKKNR